MPEVETTILSYGMGVESTAILLRWCLDEDVRPCSLDRMVVITAQVGDEYKDTGRDVEAYVLLMRRHEIRFVQVARHGHREADGITVLDDSREPTKISLDGDYKLSDELKRNGTVPQYGGVHRCALKFKAWVIEQWLEANLRGHAQHAFGYNAEERKRISHSEHAFRERIAFGFNADETKRIVRSCEYNNPTRQAFYPLLDWGWTRAKCVDYIREKLGVTWRKSACVYCPFNALKNDAVDRHLEHPEQVADALLLEHMSMALNPRGTLYKGTSLIQITTKSGNDKALNGYRQRIELGRWAQYRVRRVYTRKGQADRAVEKLDVFAGAVEARAHLAAIAATWACPSRNKGESLMSGASGGARRGFRRAKNSGRSRRQSWNRRHVAGWHGSMRNGQTSRWVFSNRKLLDGRAVRDGNPVNRRTEAPVLQEAGHAEWIGGCKRV